MTWWWAIPYVVTGMAIGRAVYVASEDQVEDHEQHFMSVAATLFWPLLVVAAVLYGVYRVTVGFPTAKERDRFKVRKAREEQLKAEAATDLVMRPHQERMHEW